MNPYPWTALKTELARWQESGLRLRVWLRDDDAIAPTPRLDDLLALSRRFAAPVLLAVIPALAQPALAERLAGEALIRPCQHGWRHQNHAPPEQKSAEFGDHRILAAMTDDLQRGRDRLRHLFPQGTAPVFVPPWNRIAAQVAAQLPGLGFAWLSAFYAAKMPMTGAIEVLHSDIDIIDWKNGRRLKEADPLEREIVALLALRRAEAAAAARLGLLLHHLVQGPDAWALLDGLLAVFGEASCVTFSHGAPGWAQA